MELEIQKKIINRNYENSMKSLHERKIKVAAYARVSLEISEQQFSFESQKRYYKKKIEQNENWIFVEVYADEGISGTQMKNRVNFMRMVDDALNGKIDLILTKSISRFARNTVDTLEIVRKLKDKNIAVYFEEENINTLDMTGELLLTILSSIAQQEIQNLSSHVTLAHKMLMKRGVCIGQPNCYGFDYDVTTKKLTINEKEAVAVRKIFKWYIEGETFLSIKRKLEKEKIPNKHGNEVWYESTIKHMLINEKYVGDLLQGKSYTSDSITHKVCKNKGQKEMYLAKNHHDAIISREDFDKVQELIAKNNIKYKNYFKVSPQSRYPFSGIFFCGFCGSRLIKKESNGIQKYQCAIRKVDTNLKCNDNKAIYYSILEKAFKEAIKRLIKKINKNRHYSDEINEKLNYIRRSLLENNLLNKYKNDEDQGFNNDVMIENTVNQKNNIDLNIIREIVEYGIVGSYDEDNKRDSFVIRFIIKTSSKSKYFDKRCIITREYIVERNRLEKNKYKMFTLLDFFIPQKMLHYEVGSDGLKHQSWISKIRVRVEIDLEGWSNSGNNKN